MPEGAPLRRDSDANSLVHGAIRGSCSCSAGAMAPTRTPSSADGLRVQVGGRDCGGGAGRIMEATDVLGERRGCRLEHEADSTTLKKYQGLNKQGGTL